MSGFFPSEIASLRADDESFMQDTCTIRQPGASTQSASGGIVAGTPTDIENVAFRPESLHQQSGGIREIATRLQLANPEVFVFSVDQAVSDRAEFLYAGHTYSTRWIEITGNQSTSKRVIVERVK